MSEYDEHVAKLQRIRQRTKVTFRVHWEADRRASIAAGSPQKRAIDMIKIETPGESPREVPYAAHHEPQYGELYKAWKASGETPAQGTPLDDWSALDEDTKRDLRAVGFHTVQQLADPTQEGTKKLGALLPWSREAKRWLEGKEKGDTALMASLMARLEEMTRRAEDLERQNIHLTQRIEAETGVKMVSDERKERLAQLEAQRLKPVAVAVSEVSATPEIRKRGRPKKSNALEVSEHVTT